MLCRVELLWSERMGTHARTHSFFSMVDFTITKAQEYLETAQILLRVELLWSKIRILPFYGEHALYKHLFIFIMLQGCLLGVQLCKTELQVNANESSRPWRMALPYVASHIKMKKKIHERQK